MYFRTRPERNSRIARPALYPPDERTDILKGASSHIATKYLYEIRSAESRQPGRRSRNRVTETIRDRSLTIGLGLTGFVWALPPLTAGAAGKS
jgi:hypothetical protein